MKVPCKVANFSPVEDTHFQMKCETVLLSHLSPLKSSLPFVQLIIALEETINVISIYPPSSGGKRKIKQREMDQ